MNIRQRPVILTLLVLQLLTSITVVFTVSSLDRPTTLGILIGIPCLIALLAGYWRYNWRGIPILNVILVATIVVTFLINPEKDRTIGTVFFLPMAIALVMTNATWTLITGIFVLIAAVIQAGPESPYDNIDQIAPYILIAICLYIGRLMIEQEQQQTKRALSDSQGAREQMQIIAESSQAQAVELQNQTIQQQQLLETISALELPLIQVSPISYLISLLGNLSQQRMQTITEGLLKEISQKKVPHLIIDISGIQSSEEAFITDFKNLIQALQLIGTAITLSGISQQTALSFAKQKIQIPNIEIVQVPYEALAYETTKRFKQTTKRGNP